MTDQDSTPPSAATPIPWQTKAIAYFWQNPWTCLWSSVLTCGGLLVLMFICRLGFLPDMNLSDVTSVLAAVALVGLVVIGTFLMVLVMPGAATRQALYDAIGGASSDGGTTDDKPPMKPPSWPDWILTILPPTFATIAVLVILIDPSCWTWLIPHASHIDFNLTMWAIFGGHLALTIIKVPLYDHGWIGQRHAYVRGLLMWLSSLFWFFAVMLLTQLMLLMAKDNLDLNPDLSTWKVTAIGSVLIFIFLGFNIVLVHVKRIHAWRAISMVAPLLLFLLVCGTQNYGFFSQLVAERLGFAQRFPTSLVVSKAGCATVNGSIRGPRLCTVDDKTEVVTLCPVLVKSRLGSQIILEVSRTSIAPNGALQWNVDKSAQQVVLRKEDVLGWGITSQHTLAGPLPAKKAQPTKKLASVQADVQNDPGQEDVKRWCQPSL